MLIFKPALISPNCIWLLSKEDLRLWVKEVKINLFKRELRRYLSRIVTKRSKSDPFLSLKPATDFLALIILGIWPTKSLRDLKPFRRISWFNSHLEVEQLPENLRALIWGAIIGWSEGNLIIWSASISF